MSRIEDHVGSQHNYSLYAEDSMHVFRGMGIFTIQRNDCDEYAQEENPVPLNSRRSGIVFGVPAKLPRAGIFSGLHFHPAGLMVFPAPDYRKRSTPLVESGHQYPSGSGMKGSVPFRLPQRLAPFEVSLAPDPWLVGAAHIRFYEMDPAEVPGFCHPAQERTNRHKISGIGIAHLERDHTSKVFGYEIETVYRRGGLPVCDKPAQDIRPSLLDPEIHIRGSRRNSGTEDPAAEPALLTGFILYCKFIHGFPCILHPVAG